MTATRTATHRVVTVLAALLAVALVAAAAHAQPGAPAEPTDDTGEGDPAAGDPAAGDPAVPGTVPAVAGDAADDEVEEVPVNLRLRRLEQRVQALKERAWRAKARVGMLKEAVLGGGVGAQASIVHKDNMSSKFRLQKLVYALDGTQIFARSGDDLYKTDNFDVLTGPIAPGSHTLSVLAVYRGHGYGVFKYLNKYKFTVRSSHTFTAAEGKLTRVEASAYERGGATTPMQDRPALDFKVSHSTGVAGN